MCLYLSTLMAFSPVLSIIPVSKNKASMQDHLSFNLKPYSIFNNQFILFWSEECFLCVINLNSKRQLFTQTQIKIVRRQLTIGFYVKCLSRLGFMKM